MSPRTKEQFEEIRESRKELIRSSALKLFALKGFHTTSISMIAHEAKISKGLIYNYYDSKEDLLKDIVLSGLEKIMGTFDPNQDGVMTDEEMVNMIDINRKMLVSERRFWSLYFSILPQPSVLEIVKDEIKQLYTNLVSLLTGYFRRKGYQDPETEAIILGSILDGVAFNYIFNPEQYPLDKVMNRIIEIYSTKDD